MKPDDISLTDLNRIFAGNVPILFYLEMVLRAFFVYFLLLGSMRMLGTRMTTRVSHLELAALVALASSVGIPMLAPDRGLLPAVISAIIVVTITLMIARWSFKNKRVEELMQGTTETLVSDSVIQLTSMKKVRISKEQLFGQLRVEGITHLGFVKRVYLEPNGIFTLVKNPKEQAGLAILPADDTEFIMAKLKPTAAELCKNCGLPSIAQQKTCSGCKENEFIKSVIEV